MDIFDDETTRLIQIYLSPAQTVPMSVELVDSMGSDLSVVNAARVSFSKNSELDNGVLKFSDRRLIRYLAEHNHWTPFGHTCLSFRIKAPIFVARQLGKHQVGLVWNEESRRYISGLPEFYQTTEWRLYNENVKQGSSDEIHTNSVNFTRRYDNLLRYSLDFYNFLLNSKVAPEQARMVLPQSMMTNWIWTGSVAAFARIYNLRVDPHAQKETKEIALTIGEHTSKIFPYSWGALTNNL